MNLGKALKQVRGDMTIKDFAEMIGVTPSYVCKLENNKQHPSIALLETIFDCTAFPVPYIFYLAMDDIEIQSSHIHATFNFDVVKPLLDDYMKRCLEPRYDF